MTANFTIIDLLRTIEAFVLFPVVFVFPGYAAAWCLDLLSFRRRLLVTRFAIAVPLSIAICPIVTDSLGRWFQPGVWLFFAACTAGFFLLSIREGRRLRAQWQWRAIFAGRTWFFALLAFWTAIAILSLVDLQIGHRLYFPTVTYDYALRVAFTSAITRTGIPPHNPCFFPGRFFDLRYHYFWLILCSLGQQLTYGTVTARQAMLAATAWCGIGLLALVAVYLRFFQPKQANNINQRSLIGAILLAVTGLDLLPVLLLEIKGHFFLPTIEWWNDDQITSWIASVLWVPHNIAALIACLTGLLLVWNAGRIPTSRQRTAASLIAAFSFASAAGLSIYVTLAFAVFLAIWAGVAFIRGHRATAGLICASGLIALALVAPFLLELFPHQPVSPASHSATHAATFPIQFGIRGLKPLRAIHALATGWKANLANLITLPLNYFLELGFFFLVGVEQCRRMWRDRHHLTEAQACGLTMLLTIVVLCSFARSSVISSNDLGWRGFLIAQFILLIWAVELIDDKFLAIRTDPRKRIGAKRLAVAFTLLLGFAASGYEVLKIRFFPFLEDTTSTRIYAWLSTDRKLGVRTFALRRIYEELNRRTPPTAIFQHDPTADPQDLFHGMYGEHQVAAETPLCNVVFGGDPRLCAERIPQIEAFFNDSRGLDSAAVDRACQSLSINVLVVKDTDKTWQDRGSWVWQRTPMLQNDFARVFQCGSAGQQNNSRHKLSAELGTTSR